MKAKRLLDRALKPFGLELVRPGAARQRYEEDGLRTIHNHDFLSDPAFRRAYERGVAAAAGMDYGWRWRIHVGLSVASWASRLRGDFVECGVNRGFLSSAIMEYLDWNSLDKTFFLLDTFRGLDERFVSTEEKRQGRALALNAQHLRSGFYVSSVDSVRANFAEWKRVRFVVGSIPETLAQVDAAEIAYLHLDLNCAPPETAASEFFWPRLVAGGFMLLDDYAYKGYHPQKIAMDAFAAKVGAHILSLPTGQGLIVKT
jgi:hypothetical protein